VALDEAQRIKNREAEVSRKVKLLQRRRAWALSGTPLENSLDDLASVLEFVTPWREGGPQTPLVGRGALLEKLRTVQLRRRKADVLPQLPPKLVSHVALPLGSAQRESYQHAERDGVIQLRERGEHVHIENVLDLVIRLKQICNFCPATGQSAKLDDLQQRLATLALEGHRALVFTQFTDGRYGARALAARLGAFRPLLFTGDLTLAQRDEVIRRFKDERGHTALVLSLRAGGIGLNLQQASYVFHFDRWWNPAVERQAEDRSHRLGQSFPVHVYTYACEGTIEERIDAVLRSKQLTFDEAIDDVSLDLRSVLTSDDVFGLFGLAPPARPSS
jgi:SNF2 family DNA or RNA helicase